MDHIGGKCANCATRNSFLINGRHHTREFEQRRFETWWGVSYKTPRREPPWLYHPGCTAWLPTTSRGCQLTRGKCCWIWTTTHLSSGRRVCDGCFLRLAHFSSDMNCAIHMCWLPNVNRGRGRFSHDFWSSYYEYLIYYQSEDSRAH